MEFLPGLEENKDQLATTTTFICISDLPAEPVPADFAGEYASLLHATPPHFDIPDFDENSRATVFHTTGTTGLAKRVFFSHRQLVLHTLSTIAALASPAAQPRLHRDDVYMPITPIFHVHAWGLPLIATVMGLRQVYPGRSRACRRAVEFHTSAARGFWGWPRQARPAPDERAQQRDMLLATL